MTLYVTSHNDVFDEAFQSAFPAVTFSRVGTVEELARELSTTRVLVTSRRRYAEGVGRLVVELATRLEWIQLTTVGTDLPPEARVPDGVVVTSARGIRGHVVAGHAIALMLGLMRGLHQYERYRARREWGREAMAGLMRWPEEETIVICGLGDVGQEAARLAKALGMHVVGVSRSGEAFGSVDEVVPRSRLDDALPRADVLLVALPLNAETAGLIGARELALLPRNAIVVNVGRGRVVDEDALAAALGAGRVAGAGLDVFADEPPDPASPLWELDNVLLTPHVAGRGGAAQRRALAALCSENLRRFLAGRPLLNSVERAALDVESMPTASSSDLARADG